MTEIGTVIKLLNCADCDAVEDVTYCTVCRAIICPRHRAGSGDLRDGYQCTERQCWHARFTKKAPRIVPDFWLGVVVGIALSMAKACVLGH